MKKNIEKYISSAPTIIFFFIVTFTLLSICFQIVLKNVFIDRLKIQNAFTDLCTTGGCKTYSIESIDWSEVYPYNSELAKQKDIYALDNKYITDENLGMVVNPLFVDYNTIFQNYVNDVSKIESTLTDYSSDFLMYGLELQAVSGVFDKIVGNHIVDEEHAYYMLSDGNCVIYSPFENSEGLDESKKDYIEKTIEPVVELNNYLEGKDIPLLYVQAPNSYDEYNKELVDNCGNSVDSLETAYITTYLSSKGVDCLNLDDAVKEQGVDKFSLFSRTESHWNTYGGFWAAGEIAKKISENYGYSYDDYYFDLNNYNNLVYQDYLIGTVGHSVTLGVLPKEDITFYIPKYDTDYELNIPSYVGVKTSGRFEDIMLDYDSLRVSNYFQNQYGAMLYLKPDYFSLHNKACTVNNGMKVLVLRESFSSVMIPYLSTQYEYIDAITPQKFDGSIWTYIDETKPDVVIVLYTLHVSDEWYDLY